MKKQLLYRIFAGCDTASEILDQEILERGGCAVWSNGNEVQIYQIIARVQDAWDHDLRMYGDRARGIHKIARARADEMEQIREIAERFYARSVLRAPWF